MNSSPHPGGDEAPISTGSLAEPAESSRLWRRDFLRSAAGASALWLTMQQSMAGLERIRGSSSDKQKPARPISNSQYETLVAFACAQMNSLFNGDPADDPPLVVDEMLAFARQAGSKMQRALSGTASWINLYSLKHTGRCFAHLAIEERKRLLNQGEYPVPPAHYGQPPAPPVILWDEDYVFHTAIATLGILGRLVICDRRAARQQVGFFWSDACRKPENLVHVDPPPYADLDQEYDVCIVGSGAGGRGGSRRRARLEGAIGRVGRLGQSRRAR